MMRERRVGGAVLRFSSLERRHPRQSPVSQDRSVCGTFGERRHLSFIGAARRVVLRSIPKLIVGLGIRLKRRLCDEVQSSTWSIAGPCRLGLDGEVPI